MLKARGEKGQLINLAGKWSSYYKTIIISELGTPCSTRSAVHIHSEEFAGNRNSHAFWSTLRIHTPYSIFFVDVARALDYCALPTNAKNSVLLEGWKLTPAFGYGTNFMLPVV